MIKTIYVSHFKDERVYILHMAKIMTPNGTPTSIVGCYIHYPHFGFYDCLDRDREYFRSKRNVTLLYDVNVHTRILQYDEYSYHYNIHGYKKIYTCMVAFLWMKKNQMITTISLMVLHVRNLTEFVIDYLLIRVIGSHIFRSFH